MVVVVAPTTMPTTSVTLVEVIGGEALPFVGQGVVDLTLTAVGVTVIVVSQLAIDGCTPDVTVC